MDHRIPKVGVVICIGLAIAAVLTFVFLNQRFEGPNPAKGVFSTPNSYTASFKDSRALPTKQPVLYKGIPVGRVNNVEWKPVEERSIVTFTLEDDFAIYKDAGLKIGERSLLGDAYLNITNRGTEAAGELSPGDQVPSGRPSVDFDEALDFLDEDGRAAVKGLIKTVADGTIRPGNGERLNGTVGGLADMVSELSDLTATLKGQEQQIARLVSSSSTVLSEIGDREQAVRTIVGSGRVTLDSLASNSDSLDTALQELPPLLSAARRSLAAADPLLREAQPVIANLRDLSPDLRKGLKDGVEFVIGPLAPIIKGVVPLRKAVEPVLGDLGDLLTKLEDLVPVIAPAARNLVPLLHYLTPRVESIAGFYALIGAASKYKDDVGNYLHAGFVLDPAETSDEPSSLPSNAYPKPGDALRPRPFKKPYPRLVPCTVPSRSHPTVPCK